MKLLMENFRKYLKEVELETPASPDEEPVELPKVSYSSVMLSDPSDINIKNILDGNPEFTKKVSTPHMTINLGELDTSRGWDLGAPVSLNVVSWGKSDKAIALKVELPPGTTVENPIPHITLATTKEGKPVDSNQIEEWDNEFKFEVKGTVEETRHKEAPKKKKPPREKKAVDPETMFLAMSRNPKLTTDFILGKIEQATGIKYGKDDIEAWKSKT
tara:strand:- start:1928 stop:2575 length:648 start_codon:yes stop_codon:yes gene_type:complete